MRPGTSCLAELPAGYDQRTTWAPIDLPGFSGLVCAHPEHPPLIIDHAGKITVITPERAESGIRKSEAYFERRLATLRLA